MKRAARAVLVFIALVAIVVVVPALRDRLLTATGEALLFADRVESGDVVALSESGDPLEFGAAEIDAADLYRAHRFQRVLLLRATPTAVDAELARRGVVLENPAVAALRQLGVPSEAIVSVDSGEGGTTESTRALAAWAREHRSRMLVLIGGAHSRRYRRALFREWPQGIPAPLVSPPAGTMFHANDWWTARRTLREGLFELQKLALDIVMHPW